MNRTLYAYLNIENPMVAWEVAIGRIKSSCDGGHEGFGVSLWQYNLFRKYSIAGAHQKLINELKLEQIRKTKFPDNVSRLKGVYFFDSLESAHAAVERWGFPERKKYICEISFQVNSITRLDSEWITSYLQSQETGWMERYLSGETLGERPLHEFIASGMGFIKNIDLRIQAYKNIKNLWPICTPLLAMAVCGFQHMELDEIALIKPALYRDGEAILGNYFINTNDLEENEEKVLEAIDICMKDKTFPPIIMPDNPEHFFALPDFRSQAFEFHESGAASLYTLVHES